MLSNKTFCYWLQGYFEISSDATLNRSKIKLINMKLGSIGEPLGIYTTWLRDVINSIKKNNYQQSIIDLFTDHIQHELNQIFIHEIDDSYDTEHSDFYLHQVHTGTVGKEVERA